MKLLYSIAFTSLLLFMKTNTKELLSSAKETRPTDTSQPRSAAEPGDPKGRLLNRPDADDTDARLPQKEPAQSSTAPARLSFRRPPRAVRNASTELDKNGSSPLGTFPSRFSVTPAGRRRLYRRGTGTRGFREQQQLPLQRRGRDSGAENWWGTFSAGRSLRGWKALLQRIRAEQQAERQRRQRGKEEQQQQRHPPLQQQQAETSSWQQPQREGDGGVTHAQTATTVPQQGKRRGSDWRQISDARWEDLVRNMTAAQLQQLLYKLQAIREQLPVPTSVGIADTCCLVG